VKALVINCTLKSSPERSNTAALAEVVAEALRQESVGVSEVRAADRSILPGVESDMGEGDEWPGIRTQILESEILVFATPTWLGRPSSFAQRVLERMDAMIAEVSGALGDIGFTIPGQAWTYWNRGPGPGDDYLESEAGKDWSHSTGKAAASNLLAAARALKANPIPAPPS
jgi:NADPH-dependent FMN reductase